MRIVQFLMIFFIVMLHQLVIAQEFPMSYSYTAQSPQIESENVISIYQEKDFAVLQTHPANENPDFTPENHWDYNLNGSFSSENFVVLKEVKEQQFLVEEEEERAFNGEMTFERKEGGQQLFQVDYSDLRVSFSPWEQGELIGGLKTSRSTLTAQVNATVMDPSGETLHQLEGVFEHTIWVSPGIPFSSIAYNLLINADAPELFIEPQNYTITNERPWLSIGDKIYEQLKGELEKKGMIVQMDSKYRYLDSEGSEYQMFDGNLRLEEVSETPEISFHPEDYPVISEELFETIYEASRYSQIEEAEIPAEGAVNLSLKNHGDYEGSGFFHSTRQFFALRAETQNSTGDTLKLVLLKISTDLPVKGTQKLSDSPISSIREQMESGPPEGFTQQFFVSGTFKNGKKLIYFLYPAKGSLTFEKVSDEMISGDFELSLEAAEVKDLKVEQILESLKGTFEAVKLN